MIGWISVLLSRSEFRVIHERSPTRTSMMLIADLLTFKKCRALRINRRYYFFFFCSFFFPLFPLFSSIFSRTVTAESVVELLQRCCVSSFSFLRPLKAYQRLKTLIKRFPLKAPLKYSNFTSSLFFFIIFILFKIIRNS